MSVLPAGPKTTKSCARLFVAFWSGGKTDMLLIASSLYSSSRVYEIVYITNITQPCLSASLKKLLTFYYIMNVIAGTPDCETNIYCRLNPFFNTCMQQVRLSKPYSQARDYCENIGEYLATFGSVDAAAWLRQQQRAGGMFDLQSQHYKERHWETIADLLVPLTGPLASLSTRFLHKILNVGGYLNENNRHAETRCQIITLKKHPEILDVTYRFFDGPDGRIGMFEVLTSSTIPSWTTHMWPLENRGF